MKEKKLVIVASAVILVTLISFFCDNFYYSTAGNTVQSSVENGLQVFLTLDPDTTTYKQGAEVFATVTLTNIGHKALNVSFDPANTYLGLDVRNSENVSVWTEGGNSGVLTVAPQRSVNDAFNWNTGSYYSMPQASIGVYQLFGFLVTDNNFTSRFQTAPLNIAIVEGS